jgi:hypothetical protein
MAEERNCSGPFAKNAGGPVLFVGEGSQARRDIRRRVAATDLAALGTRPGRQRAL